MQRGEGVWITGVCDDVAADDTSMLGQVHTTPASHHAGDFALHPEKL